MKHYFIGCAFSVLAASQAFACDADVTGLGEDIKMVLSGAEGEQDAGVVRYLSDAFFSDLACRISQRPGFDPTAPITRTAIDDAVSAILTERNQTDALVLILTAMQDAKQGGG